MGSCGVNPVASRNNYVGLLGSSDSQTKSFVWDNELEWEVAELLLVLQEQRKNWAHSSCKWSYRCYSL